MKITEVAFFGKESYTGDVYDMYQQLQVVNVVPKYDWKSSRPGALQIAHDMLSKKGSLKPLPGGSRYEYFVVDDGHNRVIGMTDPSSSRIIGVLGLSRLESCPEVYDADTISVLSDYRGQRLGLALFGLALSTLGMMITSGDAGVTPSGRKLWELTAAVPGVKTYALVAKEDLDEVRMSRVKDVECLPILHDKNWCLVPVQRAEIFFTSQHVNMKAKKVRLVAKYG